MINLFLCLLTTAWAYIPTTDFIVSRMAQKGGKGSYKIVQELLFQADNQSTIIKETWSIKDSQNYFLEVRGKTFVRFYVYNKKQKFFIDENNQVKTVNVGPDFFEYLFLARDTAGIKNDLVAKKILPAKSLRVPTRPKAIKDVKPSLEGFVHLTRNRGVVNYTFSDVTDLESTNTAPALWVEQDKFVIRRLRLASAVDLTADDVSEFSQGLSFPKSRRITWNANTVQMELLRADSVNFKPEVFTPPYLKTLVSKQAPLEESATKPLIEEFYSRFR